MAASDQQATTNPTKSVDSSLWFDSFSLLLNDLENLPLSSDLPQSLFEKLKENRVWLLNTVTQFKPPSQTSKEALNSQQVTVGSHKLSIKSQYKDLALKISSTLCLDEIQSYILVERSLDHNFRFVDGVAQGFVPETVLQYYTERQCLLKCVRQIIIHALNVGSAEKEGQVIWHEVVKLFSEELEAKLISILDKLLSSPYPEHMDVDLYVLWAEEMLIEDNLVLDILFLGYYESLCTCSAAKWKELCLLYKDMTAASSNFVRLGVSSEALKYTYCAKVQMLLILMETLDLEGLLQMIHDAIPFRDGSSVFSSNDIVEMDSVISSFDIFETQEVGLLILAWAVFLCLVASLPSKEEHNELMEIDHVGYVRQAFEAASLSLFLEILRSDILKDSDGPVAGYRSILRTFISAFIASYEINIQLEDDTLRLILTILCEIYRGEEFLCVQFWDKDSIVDGPIRCLLRSLESEFPYRIVELTRFLSALSEGSWPAECVYNFMEKSIGISSVIDIGSDSAVDGTSQIVETQLPLHVPAVEGLLIPSKTRGHVLRMVDSRTALVRWEYKQSGLLVLLLRIAQVLEKDGNEEVLVVLDLFSRLASFNTLINLPAFTELCTQYAQHSYSEGTKIKSLILNDLYYHLQGELEGRDIENGPFKELSQSLVGSKLIQAYQKQCDHELIGGDEIGQLFDLSRLRHDVGLDIWDYSEWKASKKIGETMLLHLQNANSMLFISSRLPSLRALVAILTLNTGDSVERHRSSFKRISGDEILSFIDHICKEFCATVGVLGAASDVPQEVLNYVAVQGDLLLCLARHVDGEMPSSTCLIILKTCSFGLNGLGESTLSVADIKLTIRSLFMLLLLVVKFSSLSIPIFSTTDKQYETLGEVGNISLSLLPVLCRCAEIPDQSIISLATIDMIIKRLLTPSTWLPIIQQHLQLQQLIHMLHDKRNFESLPVILKFLLTLASVKGGAEMLLASGFLPSLRVLFADIPDRGMANLVEQEKNPTMLGNIEKPQFIWGLGLAVFTAIIRSLGESSLCDDVVDNMISFLFSEKAYMVAYHLSAPDFPSDDHDKKRARAQRRQTPLSAFRETEHTLMLISVLAKHRNSWVKGVKEIGSELRERFIHLLAFISRTNHLLGESATRSSLLCVPTSKEDIDCCKRPSFMNGSGWFAVAAHGCIPTSVSDESLKTAVVVKGHANGNADSGMATYFSDTVAVQIYRTTFLMLKFLCVQADDAATRAE